MAQTRWAYVGPTSGHPCPNPTGVGQISANDGPIPLPFGEAWPILENVHGLRSGNIMDQRHMCAAAPSTPRPLQPSGRNAGKQPGNAKPPLALRKHRGATAHWPRLSRAPPRASQRIAPGRRGATHGAAPESVSGGAAAGRKWPSGQRGPPRRQRARRRPRNRRADWRPASRRATCDGAKTKARLPIKKATSMDATRDAVVRATRTAE